MNCSKKELPDIVDDRRKKFLVANGVVITDGT